MKWKNPNYIKRGKENNMTQNQQKEIEKSLEEIEKLFEEGRSGRRRYR